MCVDYTKICRVCMSNGSRDIFSKSIDNGNPLDRLLEKLRYVTMIKIEENDDLPRLLCDLCIVQLNVAYNFKRQAIENDTKLRQYFIENGISTKSTSSKTNETSTTNKRIVNDSASSNVDNSITTSTNTSAIKPQEKNNFPIIPIIVKEEPNDDIVCISDGSAVPSVATSIVPTSSTFPDKNSMVYLNNYNFNNLTPTSDVEMIHVNDRTNRTTIPRRNDNINNNEKPDSSCDTLIQIDTNRFYHKNHNINNNTQLSDTRKQLAKKRLGNNSRTRHIIPESKSKQTRTEIKKLSINMVPPMGKLSRNEMKKNVNYTQMYRIKNKLNKDTNVNIKTTSNKKVVLNPFNERDKIKKRLRPSKSGAIQNDQSKTKLLKPKIEPDTKN